MFNSLLAWLAITDFFTSEVEPYFLYVVPEANDNLIHIALRSQLKPGLKWELINEKYVNSLEVYREYKLWKSVGPKVIRIVDDIPFFKSSFKLPFEMSTHKSDDTV